jgi:putative oxidoreductase
MEGTIDKKRLIWPGLAALYEIVAPYSYALIRFAAGGIIIYHGYAKLILGFAPVVAKNILTPMGFPIPEILAYWLGILELFGGAALALGLFTRPIAFLLIIEFVIITFGWNIRFGYFFSAQGGGYEFPLLLLLIYVAIFFRGGGRLSVDRAIGKEF